MRKIELGSETELNYIHRSFDVWNPANAVVLGLYYHVKHCQITPGRSPWGLFKSSSGIYSDDTTRAVEEWSRNVVPTLPRLNRDTYKEWNQKTRFLFHIIYGSNFQDDPKFATLVQRIKQTDKHGNPSRSHRRDAIYRALKNSWESVPAFPTKG